MKSIFNQAEYLEISERFTNLNENAERQWGKMNVAQMLAHCTEGLKQALGKTPFEDKSTFLLRTLIKRIMLRAVAKGDIGKNQQTLPEFLISDERDFEQEKNILLTYLDEFFENGSQTVIARHPYFGKFSKDQWGALQYTHFDHHLTQFSA